jgi:hypothetical protein
VAFSGGGNALNLSADQFGPALRWMTTEAISRDLHIVSHTQKWRHLHPKSSMGSLWWLLFEWRPVKRLSYKDEVHTTYW